MEPEHTPRAGRASSDRSVADDRGSTSGVPRALDPVHVEADRHGSAGSADMAGQTPRPKRSLCENAHKRNR